MQKYLWPVTKGGLIFMGLLLMDFFVAMFNISQSGVTETALGIRIETERDARSMSNVVTGTWDMLVYFTVFMVLWLVYFYFKNQSKRKHSAAK
ncbi:hypothetical protein [Fructobacillus tropaeoli]|uniref:Uncharacterized protein n=1 Tax=Fructobacillus tropaeoli TaxID=709323 RepID=A0A3F3H2X4_9LACO|nr:hypothetical protein [Fructobacillus tropaeoli]CAK1224355.1 hypothetical protein LMG30237_ALEAABJJ_00054 [Fructobacillus tropaeoli]CAK1230454.1 hypothetical protein LMG30238_FMBOGHMB_00417 [Fructobacillus tropaeoli]CAK1250521.1 hypothetical protein R55227_BLOPHJLP_01344 [Fructobacillus tropaeoli]CAK1252053.1 hypothetical protein R53137_KAKDMLNK_01379 [Fructobacillus tropaeoli]GAP04252.1 hypothetical protein FTRO_0031940 [Fructobacillus tropaeoli]